MSRIRSICFALLVLFVLETPTVPAETAAAPTPAGDQRTETGPSGVFSITFPASWRAVPLTDGDYEQLGLFAGQPMDISIVVGSRPLDPIERQLDRRQLLDRMIELTMVHTAELGNEIVEVGRVEPLIEDWPAFAAVATTPDRSKMITILRSFVRDRAYVVTTLTDNRQASAELGATVARVVGSLTVHPPEPLVERSSEGPRRRGSFCIRW